MRIRWTDDDVNYVYNKNDGYCAYCEKKLSFVNYGLRGARGAWHIDHSRSLFNGGTNNRHNLFPACIDCNLDKGARNGKSYKAALVREGGRESGPGLGSIIGWGLLGFAALKALENAAKRPPAPPSAFVQPWDPWKRGRW
jgi:hypothetical protein